SKVLGIPFLDLLDFLDIFWVKILSGPPRDSLLKPNIPIFFGNVKNLLVFYALLIEIIPAPAPPKHPVTPPTAKPLLAKTTIAIMDLSATEGISASDVATISELLRTAIINTNVFTVIERGRIDLVMAELGYQQTGCTEQECAIQIGKILNARKVLIGSVGKLGTVYLVNIRVVDVETSKVEYADKGRADALEKIETVVEELAIRLANQIK
ncbi:MAG: CsgG/HfaB family protein, partial [Elusimicrobiota bacterium]|nr:CsgG/HfaB family protein [Elusimicrobiota bacterium]